MMAQASTPMKHSAPLPGAAFVALRGHVLAMERSFPAVGQGRTAPPPSVRFGVRGGLPLASRIDNGRRRLSPACFLAVLLLPHLAGCRQQEKEASARHDRETVPTLVGEQFYACDNGTLLDADFLVDGLTLELAELPDGKPLRLTAPATGLAFVGANLKVSISSGAGIRLMRTGTKPISCIKQDPAKLGSRLRVGKNQAERRNAPSPFRQEFER